MQAGRREISIYRRFQRGFFFFIVRVASKSTRPSSGDRVNIKTRFFFQFSSGRHIFILLRSENAKILGTTASFSPENVRHRFSRRFPAGGDI